MKRFISNTWLRSQNRLGEFSLEQKVEWLYAFDVHCNRFFRNIYLFAFTLAHFFFKNSFFPVFLLLYVFQFFLLPVAMYPSFFSTLFINLLYVVAFSYYLHITFLGFNGICFPFASFFPLFFLLIPILALPFLHNTVFFIYPTGLVIFVFILSLFFNFNFCVFVMNLYFGK